MDVADFDIFRRPSSTSSSLSANGGGGGSDAEDESGLDGHVGNDSSGVDWSMERHKKPPHAYATLIYLTMKHAGGGKVEGVKVTLSSVYEYILEVRVVSLCVREPWRSLCRCGASLVRSAQ